MTDETNKTAQMEVLKEALLAEVKGHQLYIHAASTAADPAVKAIFESLARDEENHIQVLKTQAKNMFDTGKLEVPPPIRLERGDIYAAISDGIYEAADPDDAMFDEDRTMEVIRKHRGSSASEILSAVREAAETFARGRPPDDDRTIIIVKRT